MYVLVHQIHLKRIQSRTKWGFFGEQNAKQVVPQIPEKCLLFQNGETCLHAAAISGNPQLVQVLLDSTADPLLANGGGQTPLDLLIMFINYGNISLSPNLLQVLNLLRPSSVLSNNCETSVQVTSTSARLVHPSPRSPAFNGSATAIVGSPEIPSEELQRIRKLVRIYCPFNFNHCSKVMHFSQQSPFWNAQNVLVLYFQFTALLSRIYDLSVWTIPWEIDNKKRENGSALFQYFCLAFQLYAKSPSWLKFLLFLLCNGHSA